MKILICVFASALLAYAQCAVYVCLIRDDDNATALLPPLKTFNTEEEEDETFIPHFDFNFTHAAISANGSLDNVTLYGGQTYELFEDIFNVIFTKNLTVLRFPNITLEGSYDMFGNIGQLFDIFGKGHFTLQMYNFTVQLVNFTFVKEQVDETHAECFQIDVEVNLTQLENNFENLMGEGNDELCELVNGAISSIAPEAVTVMWGEMKDGFEGPLQKIIDDFLDGAKQTKYEIYTKRTDDSHPNKTKLKNLPLNLKGAIENLHEQIKRKQQKLTF